MDFTDRLRILTDSSKSIAGFARLVGVSEGSIRNWLSGSSQPTPQNLRAIASACGVNVEWLTTGQGPKTATDHIAPAPGSTMVEAEHGMPYNLGERKTNYGRPEDILARQFTLVPYYPQISAAAGEGSEIFDEGTIGHLAFSRAWLASQVKAPLDKLAVIRCHGDSMRPTLEDGDAMLVARDDRPYQDGGIYILRLSNSLVVKRLKKTLKGVIVKSDNPEYGAEEITDEEAEKLVVIGQVVWIGRSIP